MTDILHKIGGVPQEGSYMASLLEKHDVDVTEAPLRPSKSILAEEDKPTEPVERTRDPLTVLADGVGAARGTALHRYSEVYNMLLAPHRSRAFSVLELLPPTVDRDASLGELEKNVSVWLTYFETAEITCLTPGMKKSDNPRVTNLNYDPQEPYSAGLALTRLSKPPSMVCHSGGGGSALQLALFMAIFPRLPSGAIYAFEGLRCQPRALESKGVTKTAPLLRGFQANGWFDHPNPRIAAELNTLAKDIAACIVLPVHGRSDTRDQHAILHKS